MIKKKMEYNPFDISVQYAIENIGMTERRNTGHANVKSF